MPKCTDQRIIDRVIAGDAKQVAELAREVGGEEVLRARAKELGLTQDFIKRCRLSGSRAALRSCMKCDTAFLSSGPQNRLCRRCG